MESEFLNRILLRITFEFKCIYECLKEKLGKLDVIHHKKKDMATTTAIILIGQAHQNHSGINPTHLIRLTENDRPALILQSIESKEKPIIIVPTVENMVDDIYLMISVFILKGLNPGKELISKERQSIHDILREQERFELYEKTKTLIQIAKIKVVFNLLDGSHLLNQIDKIKQYPNDYEITVPFIKNEFNAWSSKLEFKEFKK